MPIDFAEFDQNTQQLAYCATPANTKETGLTNDELKQRRACAKSKEKLEVVYLPEDELPVARKVRRSNCCSSELLLLSWRLSVPLADPH
jgi:hypothetical protein